MENFLATNNNVRKAKEEINELVTASEMIKSPDLLNVSLAVHEHAETLSRSAHELADHKMTATTKGDPTSTGAQSLVQLHDQKIAADQAIIHPVVLGNVTGASLLAAAVRNKQELLQAPLYLSHQFGGQLMNVMPIFIQQPNSSSQIYKQWPVSTATVLMAPACHPSQFQDVEKQKMPDLHYQPTDESSSSGSFTKHDSELFFRSPLSSSATVILSSSSLIPSNVLSTSVPTLVSSDSFLGNILRQDLSLVSSSSKPFSLLPGISDRSVSLESIPSLDLIQPDKESVSNLNLLKSGAVQVSAVPGEATRECPLVDFTSSAAVSLCDQEQKDKGDSDTDNEMQIEEALSAESVKSDLSRSDTVILNNLDHKAKTDTIVLDNEDHSARADTIVLDNEDHSAGTDTVIINNEDHNALADTNILANKDHCPRTDTNVLDKEDHNTRNDTIILGNEDHSTRNDTVILIIGKDKSIAYSDHGPQSSSSVVSSRRETDTLNGKILTNDFGLVPSFSNCLPQDVYVNESAVCNIDSINQSLVNQPTPLYQNGCINKSFYIMTNDGQLTAFKYISSDPLDITQLSQLRLPTSTDTYPLFSPEISNSAEKTVEAKETQTELVFGTNTVLIKTLDAVKGESVYAVDQPSSTVFTPFSSVLTPVTAVFTETVSIQPSTVTPAVIINDNTGQRPIISVDTDENASSSNIQTLPQGMGLLECQENFKSKQELVNQEKFNKRGFKCDLCNSTFTRVGNFTRHRKIHNLQSETLSSFKCSECGREFLQRCDLKRHMLIHTKQEPHRCEKCGKGYIRHSDLVVHMRFHNKDKAFKCSLCDKKFFQTGDLSRHVRRSHQPNSQLTCGHCNRKYACESTLIRHMKAVHKDIIMCSMNRTLQEPDSSGKSVLVNAKDVLFTMTETKN